MRLLENFGRDRGAAHRRRAKRQAVAAHDQHLAELDDLAGLAFDFTDLDHILGSDPVLLAARFKDREHLPSSSKLVTKPQSKPDARVIPPGPDSSSLFC